MCADLFARIENVVKDAFALSEMIPEEMTAVVLVGGGTRIPKVQENLLKATQKSELAKNLNTDESPALGAVYQAAFASKGYKVLKFYIKDMNLFPIVVDFQKHSDPESAQSGEKSYIRRTLFDKTNQFPQKKVMTFNKHTVDFDFRVNYGDLSYLSQDAVNHLGSANITQVDVTGVKAVFEKHANQESKGIKVHFKIDDNGILHLEKIDIAFEKDGPATDDEASTLSKLGSKISSFFGASEEEKEGKADEEKKEGEEADQKSTEKPSTDETKEKTLNETVAPLNSSNSTVPKNVTTILREEISYVQMDLDYFNRTDEMASESKKKLLFIKEKERDLKNKAKAINTLESYLFETKDKLTQDEFIAASTEAERELISDKAAQITDWLDEADMNVETKEYNEQLRSLKKLCKDVTFRLTEKKNRPKRLEEMKVVFNKSMDFLNSIKNLTGNGVDTPLTLVQYETFEKLINSTLEWEEKMLAEQALVKDNETPKLLCSDITDKTDALRREVGYLVSKIKYFRPPTTKKPPVKEKVKKQANNGTEDAVPETEEAEKEKEDTAEKTAEEETTTNVDENEETTTVKMTTSEQEKLETDNPEL